MLLFGFFHFQGNGAFAQFLDEPAHAIFPGFALLAGLFSQPFSVQCSYTKADEPVRDEALLCQVDEEFHDFPLFGNQGMKALVLC
jgi:hypothetical protein